MEQQQYAIKFYLKLGNSAKKKFHKANQVFFEEPSCSDNSMIQKVNNGIKIVEEERGTGKLSQDSHKCSSF